MGKRYVVRHGDEVDGVDCPCGLSRRILTRKDSDAASLHVVRIKRDSEIHYHKVRTEFYYVLRGEGQMYLDGDVVPVRQGHAIAIPPGVTHRARGDLEILNVVIPPHAPGDEYIVEDAAAGR